MIYLYPNHPSFGTNAAKIVLENGSTIDVSGYPTAGIQEALNYAAYGSIKVPSSPREAPYQGYDLHIVGGGDVKEMKDNVNPSVVYNCTQPIDFPPLQGRSITTGACTWNFAFEGTEYENKVAVNVNSCMMVNIDFNGQIVYNGSYYALGFNPRDKLYDGFSAITDSRFHFMTVVNISQTSDPNSDTGCVIFESPSGPISNCTLTFEEINGTSYESGKAVGPVSFGILVRTRAPGHHAFSYNYITCPHIHDFSNTCIKAGDQRDAQQEVFANTWRVNCSSKKSTGNHLRGIDTYGHNDYWEVAMEASDGTEGILLEPNAKDNILMVKSIKGFTTPVGGNKEQNKVYGNA